MIDLAYVKEEFALFHEYALVFGDNDSVLYRMVDDVSSLKTISFFKNYIVYELQTTTKNKRKRVKYDPVFAIPENEEEFKYFISNKTPE